MVQQFIVERTRQVARAAAVNSWTAGQVKNYLVYGSATAPNSDGNDVPPGHMGLLPSQVSYTTADAARGAGLPNQGHGSGRPRSRLHSVDRRNLQIRARDRECARAEHGRPANLLRSIIGRWKRGGARELLLWRRRGMTDATTAPAHSATEPSTPRTSSRPSAVCAPCSANSAPSTGKACRGSAIIWSRSLSRSRRITRPAVTGHAAETGTIEAPASLIAFLNERGNRDAKSRHGC